MERLAHYIASCICGMQRERDAGAAPYPSEVHGYVHGVVEALYLSSPAALNLRTYTQLNTHLNTHLNPQLNTHLNT